MTTTKAVTTTLSTKPKQVTTVSTTAENSFDTIPVNADTKLMYEAYQSELEGYGRPEWYSYIEINKNDIIPPPEASYKVSSRTVHESEYGHKTLDNFAICYYDSHNNLLVEYYGYSDTSQPDIMYYSDLYSYEYNEKSGLLITEYDNVVIPNIERVVKSVYEYDDSGRISQIIYYRNDLYFCCDIFEYDSAYPEYNRMKRVYYKDGKAVTDIKAEYEYTYYSDNNICTRNNLNRWTNAITYYSYDEKGNLSSINDENTRTVYKYDSENRVIEEKFYINDKLNSTTTYEYENCN